MNTPTRCAVPLQDVVAYWLGELDAAGEQRFEEHFFGCAECSARLEEIAGFGKAIRGELLEGRFAFVLPAAFVRRIKEAGLRVREYTLEPGTSVDCTVTPEDDLVAAYLHAPLGGVRQLDVVVDDAIAGTARVRDVAFDPESPGIAAVPSVAFLRTLRHHEQRVRLIAVDGDEERVLGDYTFKHYPST